MARRSKLKIAGLGCSGFLLLITIGIGILFMYSANVLKSQMAASQKQGKILTVDDLVKVSVPPGQNAAPVYDQAFNEISKLRAGTPGSPSPCKVIEAFISADKNNADPKLWNDIRPAVMQSQTVVDILEQASRKPRCQFPVNWQDWPNVNFPHLDDLKESSRALSAHAILAAKEGNSGRAVDLLCTNFRVCKSVDNEPGIISHLFMTSITAIASDSLKQVAGLQNINEANSKRLFDTLDTLDLKHSYRRGIEGERALGLATFSVVRKDPGEMVAGSLGDGSMSSLEKMLGCAWRPVSNMDKATYLRLMQKNIDSADCTYRDLMTKNISAAKQNLPKYALFSQIMYPMYDRAMQRRDAAIVDVRGSQVFLALLAYKDRFGFYPAKLADLNKLGWKLDAVDVFSGKDFQYQQRNKGFLLYSIGPNLKDDGGVSNQRPGGNRSRPDDVVWKLEK